MDINEIINCMDELEVFKLVNKLVVVIVPIYKEKLDEYEQISLQQVNRILDKYLKIFIAPQSLKFNYGYNLNDWKIERFPDKYFESTATYSELMLSVDFYYKFAEYKFMLVYQLDALVFSDRLKEFCQMGYDYIGAPVDYFSKAHECKSYVVNGGFSLRNIPSVIYLLTNTVKLRSTHKLSDWWNIYEDRFFSFCGGEKICGFKIAPSKIAVDFSFDDNVERCFKRNHFKLPFGCHAWNRKNSKFYFLVLKQYGYKINESNYFYTSDDNKMRKNRILSYFCTRYLREKQSEGYFKYELEKIFKCTSQSYSIFGCGNNGVLCKEILEREDISIFNFYDNYKKFENDKFRDILVEKPDKQLIKKKKTLIIIALSIHEKDIYKQLIHMGLIYTVDFVYFSEIISKVLERRYGLNLDTI